MRVSSGLDSAVRQRTVLLAVICVALSVSACTTAGSGPQPQQVRGATTQESFDARSHGRIAQNFISTLAQLKSFSPIHTTIQMMEPNTPFGKAIEHHIIESGYGHQLVNGDMGRHFLRYRIEDVNDQHHLTRIYHLSVGDITLEREFRTLDSHLTPVSAMRISGTSTAGVVLRDDIFRFNNPHEFVSKVTPVVAKSLRRQAEEADPRPANASVLKLPGSGLSNYVSVFQRFTEQQELLLPFADGSHKLSFVNWDKMEKLVAEFDPQRDIFSVIGCSRGNLALAVRRTERVRQALVRGGISAHRIYAESCSDERYATRDYPARAVLLTIMRML